ncbi:MAG TPA: uracil-DNA glycosylase [Opitutaceae bacterium]
MPPRLILPSSWQGLFSSEYTANDFERLLSVVDQRYTTEVVLPAAGNVFRALERVPPAGIKVVILGQDPYPTPGNAHGLSFSVQPGVKIPRSLRTIFAELKRTTPGWVEPTNGTLETWADQGVLLLNAVLTVQASAPLSHAGIGWEAFTAAVLRHAQAQSPFLVFLLWGAKAAAIADPVIDSSKHAVLRGSHPSPMAQNQLPPDRKFVGCGHFLEANRLLAARGRSPIDWRLAAGPAEATLF